MEHWLPVSGYEGYYEISDDGRVRSVPRDVVKSNGVIQHRKGVVLAAKQSSDGYLSVTLCKEGSSKTYKIHRLVFEAFARPLEFDEEVDHIDFNRKNNKLENLQALTHRANVSKSVTAGRNFAAKQDISGSNNPNFGNKKLSEYYKNNPEICKEKQSRPGSSNGRCVPVVISDERGSVYAFDYIRQCANFLVSTMSLTQSAESVAIRIKKVMDTDVTYLGYKYHSQQTISCQASAETRMKV